jgi:hypothetical protein
MDAGSAPVAGTLHVYAISQDNGNVDYLCSNPAITAPGSPVMPSGWTHRRYIGSLLVRSSAIVNFKQRGDDFDLVTPIQDYIAGSFNFQMTLVTSVPIGLSVKGRYVIGHCGNATVAEYVYLYPPDTNALSSVTSLGGQAGSGASNGANHGGGSAEVWTDSTAQIKVEEIGTGTIVLYISTLGWIDRRMAFAGYE